MSAGLPGLGLSGLFVLLSVLALPAVSRVRSHDHRIPRAKLISIVALGAAITAAAIASWYAVALAVRATGAAPKQSSGAGEIFGLPVIVVSLFILTAILVVPEVLLHLIGTRPTPAVPPVDNPHRAARSDP